MPAIVYKNAAGERLPSVTTVLKQLGWSTDALMYWAWMQGCEGINFREARQDAADVGTVAHAAIEADLKGEDFAPSMLFGLSEEQVVLVNKCLSAWREWRDQTKLVPVASEQSMVSEEHQYGGTLDVATVYSRLGILDVKTSKSLYVDTLLQIRAYGELWTENKGEAPQEYHVIRLGKEDGSFHHHRWGAEALDDAWEAFLCAKKLHGIQKKLKRAI